MCPDREEDVSTLVIVVVELAGCVGRAANNRVFIPRQVIPSVLDRRYCLAPCISASVLLFNKLSYGIVRGHA